jgi:hypothetical protein
MKHLYEIFEKFPDRSSLWRDSAVGVRMAQVKALELAMKSANEFYAIDLTSGKVLRLNRESEGEKTPAGQFRELQTEKRLRVYSPGI